MVTRQIQNRLILFFMLMSFLLSFTSMALFNSQSLNYAKEKKPLMPELALPALPHYAITQNATNIYRLFETVNITINTFDFPDTDYVKMQISFSNGSTKFFDMVNVATNRYNYKYTPEYNAPLGFQNISFLIYNVTDQLINSHTTYTNFTIFTNYMVNLNSCEYYIEDTLYGEILVSNFSTYDFTWNTTVVDSLEESDQDNIINFDKDIVQFATPLLNDTFDKNQFYYIQLNMTDKLSARRETAYFPFYVKNNRPFINSSIILSPEEVFRTEDFTISFNVTDVESKSEDLIPRMRIYDAEGALVIQNVIDFDTNNLFSETFNIPANRPIGKYRVNVTLTDEHGGYSSKGTYLTVKNNAPEIHSYTINGLNMNETISIFYGRNLVFSFNVSDIEELSYVKVALLNTNNEWYNISHAYIGENTEITIRTFDLIDGIWYVYLYVIDSDGAVVSLTDDYSKAPQAIRIIPDVISYYLPWILIFGGVTLGILLGIVATYSYFKSRSELQRITPKKKDIPAKKLVTKKKIKAKPGKEELEKKEIDESKPEKEKDREEVPQRKIKRKL
ncbi:MAG: hypothetical protein ACFE9S_12395 [Candidatus Hermodarchaeota archaeon]